MCPVPDAIQRLPSKEKKPRDILPRELGGSRIANKKEIG